MLLSFAVRLMISFLLIAPLSFSQKWKVKAITPTEKIEKNQRFEIGLTPPQNILDEIQHYLSGQAHQRKGLNPFVSWDIDLTADFTHQESGTKVKGVAFWYTEVERDHLNGHWNQLDTDLPFRIRFSPPLEGKWSVLISSQIQNGKKNVIEEININVKNSDKPGHVGIHNSKRYLQRDGDVILPTGVNLPYPYVNNNLLYSQDRDEKLKLNSWVEYRELVQQYIIEGGKYFRFFIHPSTTDIEFEEVGYYQSRQHFAWEVDHIIEICEKNNAMINFNLMYHTMMMKMGDYYQFKYDYTDNWYDTKVWPYKDINHISGYSKLLSSKTPSDMIFEDRAFKYLKEKTRYMMARWGYSTAISSIELVSEPWHLNQDGFTHETPYDSLTQEGNLTRKAAFKYHTELAAYIKDSLSMDFKLIGAVGRFPVGNTNIYSHNTSTTPKQVDSTWYDDNIDIISISYYSSSPEKAILSKNTSNNEFGSGENSIASVIKRLNKTYDKPVVFSESDHGDGTPICSDLQGHRIDIKRYAYTGAAGHYIWAAFNYPHSSNEQPQDERASWSEIINAQQFYNDEFLTSIFKNQFIQGREKSAFNGSRSAIVEQQYLIDSSRSKGAGYIYNRTFNIHTASGNVTQKESNCYLPNPEFREPITITWKPQRLKVNGLRRFNKYIIRYYGFSGGELLLENEQRSSIFGKLKLVHPELTPRKDGNPLLWYTIQKK